MKKTTTTETFQNSDGLTRTERTKVTTKYLLFGFVLIFKSVDEIFAIMPN